MSEKTIGFKKERRLTRFIFEEEIPKELTEICVLEGVRLGGYCSPIYCGRLILGKTSPTVILDNLAFSFDNNQNTPQTAVFVTSAATIHELIHGLSGIYNERIVDKYTHECLSEMKTKILEELLLGKESEI